MKFNYSMFVLGIGVIFILLLNVSSSKFVKIVNKMVVVFVIVISGVDLGN